MRTDSNGFMLAWCAFAFAALGAVFWWSCAFIPGFRPGFMNVAAVSTDAAVKAGR